MSIVICIMVPHIRKLIFLRPSTMIGCFVVKPKLVLNPSDDETPKEFTTFRPKTVAGPKRSLTAVHDVV